MDRQLFTDTLGWGFALWVIGYILGFVFFAIIPASLIGWAITPIGTIITLWVLLKKVKGEYLGNYVVIGVVWTVIAVALDYLFVVRLLHPSDGYYKLDVYLYYVLTFILPIVVGYYKTFSRAISNEH